MSYVRLLRLPPYAHPSVAARCWRRQAGSRGGGRPDNLLHEGPGPSDSRHFTRQHATQYHSDRGTPHHCSHFARAATARGVPGYAHQGQAGIDKAGDPVGQRRANVTNATSSETPVFGADSSVWRPGPLRPAAFSSGSRTVRMSSLPRGGGAWGAQEMQLQSQSLRGFASASVPPDPKEPAPDSTEQPNNGSRALAGQRAFLGGLLKPSDVSRYLDCRTRTVHSHYDATIILVRCHCPALLLSAIPMHIYCYPCSRVAAVQLLCAFNHCSWGEHAAVTALC